MSLLIRASTKPALAPNRSVKKNKTVKKTTSSVKAPPLKPVERPNDFLSMAERINGRAAMIGFTSAVIDEVMTGNSISTQFRDNVGLSVAVAAFGVPRNSGES